MHIAWQVVHARIFNISKFSQCTPYPLHTLHAHWQGQVRAIAHPKIMQVSALLYLRQMDEPCSGKKYLPNVNKAGHVFNLFPFPKQQYCRLFQTERVCR